MEGIEPHKPVLFVMPSDRLAGAENILKITMSTLAARVERIHVIFMSHKAENNWDDLPENITVHVVDSATEKGGLLPTLGLVRKLCAQNRFQAAISSHAHVNAFLGLLRRSGILKTDRLITRESNVTFDKYQGLSGRLFRYLYLTGYPASDLVVTQTSFMEERLLVNLPASAKWNVQTIHSPFNADKIQALAQKEVPALTSAPYLVTAGRLEPVKAFDLLLEAFASLPETFDHYQLLILGEGSQREALETQAEALGLKDRVLMPGFVPNPIPYFREAALCVASSHMEGFANVILQMMSQNEAVATTLGTPEYAKIQGLLTCPPGTKDLIRDMIVQGLSLTDSERAKNRELFDAYLARRKPGAFVEKLWKEASVK